MGKSSDIAELIYYRFSLEVHESHGRCDRPSWIFGG